MTRPAIGREVADPSCLQPRARKGQGVDGRLGMSRVRWLARKVEIMERRQREKGRRLCLADGTGKGWLGTSGHQTHFYASFIRYLSTGWQIMMA